MNLLPMSFAMEDYDHVRDVRSGEIPIEGIQPYFSNLRIEETTDRMMKYRDFDVTELSFGNYASMLNLEKPPAIALPIFLSRRFRHSAFFVSCESKLSQIGELRGKTIGVPQWSQTASIYARGIVTDAGIRLSDINWIQAGLYEKGRAESANFTLPPNVKVTPRPDKNLTDMLLAGEIDVLITARPPQLVFDGKAKIRRLLADSRAAELEYWRAHRVFPIMHLLTINRRVYEQNRWIARNILLAFEKSKRQSVARLSNHGVSQLAMPWGAEEFEDMSALIFPGQEPWPYTVEGSRPTLTKFLKYCHQQGITKQPHQAEDIFAPETLLNVKI